MRISQSLAAIASAALLRAAAADTIAEIAGAPENDGLTGTLFDLVLLAGLGDTLSDASAGPFTVFAPTNAAFASLLRHAPAAASDYLLSGEDYTNGLVRDLLLFHVLSGELTRQQIVDAVAGGLESVATLAGVDISPVLDARARVNGQAALVATDIDASNGIVHVIGSVLVPEGATLTKSIYTIARTSGVTKTLARLLCTARLRPLFDGKGDELPIFTVFAPTDDAFAAVGASELRFLRANRPLLVKVLSYHVLPTAVASSDIAGSTVSPTTLEGSALTVSLPSVGTGGASIVPAAVDIKAFNGIVHVIDAVLLPADYPTGTIFDVAGSSDDFGTLVAAVGAASGSEFPLRRQLKSPGSLTVFAPTNAAFAASGLDLAKLLRNNALARRALRRLLGAHLVKSQLSAADLGEKTSFRSASGRVLTSQLVLGATDILAKNGIVHVVNEVIIPRSCRHLINRFML